jgi:uncharacterized protein
MAFLTARWSNLCLFTYAVPAALLRPRVPPGLELDRREGLAGEAFVSLVAFDFLETRVLGVPWPGFRNFPEINLRFYVRRPTPDGGAERGVVFIREFVPQQLVAWMARRLYHEPYVAAPMSSRVTQADDAITVEHHVTYARRTHTLSMTADRPAACPPESGVEHFFKEHRWGYGVTPRGRLIRYEVLHPVWDCHRVRSWRVDLDWASVYGPEWAFLQGQEPVSTTLAVGSAVSVMPKGTPAAEGRSS